MDFYAETRSETTAEGNIVSTKYTYIPVITDENLYERQLIKTEIMETKINEITPRR